VPTIFHRAQSAGADRVHPARHRVFPGARRRLGCVAARRNLGDDGRCTCPLAAPPVGRYNSPALLAPIKGLATYRAVAFSRKTR
jgi:hypothetical protein